MGAAVEIENLSPWIFSKVASSSLKAYNSNRCIARTNISWMHLLYVILSTTFNTFLQLWIKRLYPCCIFSLPNVDQDKQHNPDNINKMPEQRSCIYTKMTCVVVTRDERAAKNNYLQQNTSQNV